MNNYDEILFNDKLKNKKKGDPASIGTINTYRNIDVSEYPNFKNNMKMYRKRVFALIKTMMYSNDKKYKNDDELDVITIKFIEICDEIFRHFEHLKNVDTVNEQFSILSKIDKILLSNNSS